MLQILNASYALGKDVNLEEFHILSAEEYYGRVWHNDVQLQGTARTVYVPVLIAIVVLCSFQLKAFSDLFPFILIAGITGGCMILSRTSYFCQSY